MKPARAKKRLEKQLIDLQTNFKFFEPIINVREPLYNTHFQEDDQYRWEVLFYGPKDSIYSGEKFILQFVFDGDYVSVSQRDFIFTQQPITAPLVKFKPPFLPKHQHVYSNGFICLSTLYDDWTPSLRVSSICLSVQSMIASATKKMHPPGYQSLIGYSDPRKLSWIYEDVTC